MSSAIRIVLVDTSHPGNIGASARAMKNMGLESLVLVRPQSYPDPEATARASGAADVLARARVVATVDEAIGDCGLVVGTTARARSANWRVVDSRDGAGELAAATDSRPAAVLFGGERNGLANEDLARCQALIRIPSSAGYESLNLAQAVQIVCYEVLLATRRLAIDPAGSAECAATADEMLALERPSRARDARDGIHARRQCRAARRARAAPGGPRARPTTAKYGSCAAGLPPSNAGCGRAADRDDNAAADLPRLCRDRAAGWPRRSDHGRMPCGSGDAGEPVLHPQRRRAQWPSQIAAFSRPGRPPRQCAARVDRLHFGCDRERQSRDPRRCACGGCHGASHRHLADRASRGTRRLS